MLVAPLGFNQINVFCRYNFEEVLSTIATIFTGVASAVLFGHTLTINFVLGISIVIISMHQVTCFHSCNELIVLVSLLIFLLPFVC
jgi:multidrug transporter EmrE-like cation transporter